MKDGPSGLEVLLTKRPRRLRFMGGAMVFPGGAVEPADLDDGWAAHSAIDPAAAGEALGEEDAAVALASYICALRESFEEVGLLLTTDPPGELHRSERRDGGDLLRLCREEGLTLATADLVPAGRWVTPEGSPVRFDTRFFLAESPQGWEPDPDPAEVDGCRWSTPSAALSDLAAGSALMAPPTVEMLQRLDAYTTVAGARAGLAERGLKGAGHILSLRVSPLVHVVLAPNPGVMTGPGTNTYIVGTDPTFVIDPAVDDDLYIRSVLEAAGRVAAILVTHRHGDHVGGAKALAEATGAPVRAWGTTPAGAAEVEPLSDGERISAGGVELLCLYAPGHASDHMCFVLEGAASLFAGDNVLGEGTAVIAPPDGNMRDYLATLERLKALPIDRIYPGHFRPLDGGSAVIEGYIRHRKARAEAILAALKDGPKTLEEIVDVVYTDTPAHLHPVARFSVAAQLELAEDEGRAGCVDDRWFLSDER
ncbi:MAG: MBL fold metallo-hydrolase [Actinomycetota bacterium]